MRLPLALYAFAILTFTACSSAAPSLIDAGVGGSTDPGGYHPCGYPGSEAANACAAIGAGFAAYCADGDASEPPFSDCDKADASAQVWCCPFTDGGAS